MLEFAISPLGCALAAYIIFLASITVITPRNYEDVVHETDHMFLNPVLFVFFSACVLSFTAGVFFFRRIAKLWPQAAIIPNVTDATAVLAICALLLACGMNIYSIAVIIGNTGDIVSGLLSGSGSIVKQTIDSTGALTEAMPLLFAVIWWSIIQYERRPRPSRPVWWFLLALICAACAIVLITTVVRVARYELIPFILGLGFIEARRRLGNGTANSRFLILLGLGAPIALGFIFVGFSFLRGIDDIDKQLYTLYGYGPASYNRLALVLSGDLHYDSYGFSGHTLLFLENIPFFHQFINTQELLGLPDMQRVFLSQFTEVYRSGLDPSFIWCTAFGYYFTDLGVFVFLFLAAMGFAAQALFESWRRVTALGLIMYTFVAGTVILWGTSNLVVYPRLITLLVTALILSSLNSYLTRLAPRRSA